MSRYQSAQRSQYRLWDSWADFAKDFSKNFDEVDRHFSGVSAAAKPSCDIEETAGAYWISIDVPGVAKDDIDIEVRDGQLLVSGERKHPAKQQDAQHKGLMAERTFGRFSRVFTLPEGVRAHEIEASYENGVLCLQVPKSEKPKAQKIRIMDAALDQDQSSTSTTQEREQESELRAAVH